MHLPTSASLPSQGLAEWRSDRRIARSAEASPNRLELSLAQIAKLYVIAASHPCATVEKGLKLKRFPYRQVELTAGYHHVHQRLRFGARSVPAIRFADGENMEVLDFGMGPPA